MEGNTSGKSKGKGKSIDPHGTVGKQKRKSIEVWKELVSGKRKKSSDEILKEIDEINEYNKQIDLLDLLLSCNERDSEYPMNHEHDFENFYQTVLNGEHGHYPSLKHAQLEVKALMERFDETSTKKPESRKMNEYEEMIYNRSLKLWAEGKNRGIISSFKEGKSTDEEESDLGSDDEVEGIDYGDSF